LLSDDFLYADYSFSENKQKSFCEITDTDFSGGIDLVCDNIKKHLNSFYPEIDWELHYYERYGDVFDSITISINGRQYSGEYEVLLPPDEEFLEEEYEIWEADGAVGDLPPKTLDEWYETVDFTVQKPTEKIPYPIPRYVLDEFDAGDKVWYWACDKFQGSVTPATYGPWRK